MKFQSSHNEFQEAMSAKISIVSTQNLTNLKNHPPISAAGLLGPDLVVGHNHGPCNRDALFLAICSSSIK